MNLMKKVIVFLAILIGTSSAFALEVMDVKANYWAAREISNSILNGYLSLNENNEFLPEGQISRTDFVNGLVKVLGGENLEILSSNMMTDLNENTRNLKNILIAEQLKIIYGYPDNTFKPEVSATRAEASSALGHITKGAYNNTSILNRFEDANEIPEWAVLPYAKAVKNGFYINYPNRNALRPNEYLTRAEAAVLFDKVSKSLELVDPMYKQDLVTKIPDILQTTETVNVHKKPITNVVEIYNTKKVVKAGNIIKGIFQTPINFKKAKVGDIVEFSAPEDLITEQGTFIYGAGTKFNAQVLKIKPTAWREKNGKTLLVLDKITTTEGLSYDMAAVPLSRDKKFLWIEWSNLVYTTDKNPNWIPKKHGKKWAQADFLVDYGYTVSPRVKYKNKIGDEVYILLTDDLVLRNPEINGK